MAINDLLGNFLYIYIFIIIFYFTSRSIDGYTEVKRIEKLRGSNPVSIVLTQYARGRIDESMMKNQIAKLNEIANSKQIAEQAITKLEEALE
jgi:hypothetical protein